MATIANSGGAVLLGVPGLVVLGVAVAFFTGVLWSLVSVMREALGVSGRALAVRDGRAEARGPWRRVARG